MKMRNLSWEIGIQQKKKKMEIKNLKYIFRLKQKKKKKKKRKKRLSIPQQYKKVKEVF